MDTYTVTTKFQNGWLTCTNDEKRYTVPIDYVGPDRILHITTCIDLPAPYGYAPVGETIPDMSFPSAEHVEYVVGNDLEFGLLCFENASHLKEIISVMKTPQSEIRFDEYSFTDAKCIPRKVIQRQIVPARRFTRAGFELLEEVVAHCARTDDIESIHALVSITEEHASIEDAILHFIHDDDLEALIKIERLLGVSLKDIPFAFSACDAMNDQSLNVFKYLLQQQRFYGWWQTPDGWYEWGSVLEYAIVKNRADFAEMILNAGMNPFVTVGREEEPILDFANRFHCFDIAEMIEQHQDLIRSAQVKLGVTPLLQNHGPWKHTRLGNSTIGEAGSVLTAVTMLYNYANNKNLTPDQMKSKLTFNASGELDLDSLSNVNCNLTWGEISLVEIYTKLKEGTPVILFSYGASGSRAVVVTGYTGNGMSFHASDFIIRDPSCVRTSLAQHFEYFPTIKWHAS